MIFQAYVLDDAEMLIKLGTPYPARTSLDAVQQAQEYWPGLHPIVEEELPPVPSKIAQLSTQEPGKKL